jgi:hypothetical protein
VVGQRKWSGAAAFQGGGRALVAEEGVDEVLQLEEAMGEVRHGPKGVDEGALGSSPKGREMAVRRREDDVTAAVRSGGCGTQGRRERGRRVTGCSGALMREDERGKKGGVAAMGCPL